MKTILYVLAAIGVVLVILALYVFLVAARTFVSESDRPPSRDREDSGGTVTHLQTRAAQDRRRNPDRRRFTGQALFPLVDSNGLLVEADRRMFDRRTGSERRRS